MACVCELEMRWMKMVRFVIVFEMRGGGCLEKVAVCVHVHM